MMSQTLQKYFLKSFEQVQNIELHLESNFMPSYQRPEYILRIMYKYINNLLNLKDTKPVESISYACSKQLINSPIYQLIYRFSIIFQLLMSQSGKEEKKSGQNKQDKLKQIQALYRSQIKQIYSQSKDKIQKQEQAKKPIESLISKPVQQKPYIQSSYSPPPKGLSHVRSASNLLIAENTSGSRLYNFQEGEEKVRASIFLRGESTRTIQVLRRQNQTKELKIRELTNRCEGLIDKLKKYVEVGQLDKQLESLKQFSDDKAERLENLFKIKNEQIFFKIKLQIITLLQEFGVSKDQIGDINEVNNETSLFSYLARKLKSRLKDFRSKQQEKTFQIQKDKIISQKQEERIHYLTETNELLRLSQSKFKAKVEDLKNQLNDYLDKLKSREQQNQERQNEIFRLRKQNEELSTINQKLSTTVKGVNSEKVDERRVWQAKERQYKTLLNNYLLDKKKLQGEIQDQEGQMEEVLIKQRFLEQENERINRELIRWKERYEWLQKEKEAKLKDLEEEKNQILNQIQDYKLEHNEGVILNHRSDFQEAMRRVQQYQNAYQSVLVQLEQQRRLLQRSQDQSQERVEKMERQWLQRVKRLEREKQQEINDINHDNEVKQNEIRQQFEQKQKLLAQEMQARMKTLLAERDKKTTQQLILLSNENDELRREIENLHKLLDVKQSLINVIQNKNSWTLQDK